jgi:uncharacterized membrane protein YqjE
MMDEKVSTRDDRPLGELFSDLARETTQLIRQEVQLAKTEMTQKAVRVGKDIGMLAAGGVLAFMGLLGIMATIVIAIADAGLPWWASTLLVGGVVLCIGGGLAFAGLSALRRVDPVPRETMRTIEEDKQWARRQTA